MKNRKSVAKRYFKAKEEEVDGKPIPGTEDEEIWIDMELLIGFSARSSEGPYYKWMDWALDWESTRRTIRWKRIYKDEENDPEAYVQIPIPDIAYFTSGIGPDHRRMGIAYENGKLNEARKVLVMRVFHAEFSDNDEIDVDRDDFLDVEVPLSFIMTGDAGEGYYLENWFLESGEVPVTRRTLNEKEYKVKEKPDSDTREVWPSKREKAET